VALVPQRTTLVPGTVADNLTLPWTLHARHGTAAPGREAMRRALDSVAMPDVELDRDATRLSVGQASRVALLRVVLTRPEVLLLDEPDAALDDDSASLVSALIRAFVAEGGAALRVRHLRADDGADVRYRLEGGRLSLIEDAAAAASSSASAASGDAGEGSS
jgi:putative ABC transport system ATP-binding protein